MAGTAVPPVDVHPGSNRLKVARFDAAPPQPVRILRSSSRWAAAQVVQLSGLPVSADKQELHQAVNEPVATVYKAVGVTAFVDAAGPQTAPRFVVWLNQGGNLLKQGVHCIWWQPR